MKVFKSWLLYAIVTTIFWGVWGAFIEIPEKAGFPATLGYVVWSLTMIPCALFALHRIKWKIEIDKKSIFLGSAIGILGAGGQLLLFQALRDGPAYIIFPLISLSPALTILLSVTLLKEKTTLLKWIGIFTAITAIFFLSYQEPGASDGRGYLWLALSIMVFIAWGVQAFVMKFSNETMKAESIFFFMTITAILLAPFALWMTDFSQPINWGFKGPYLAALVHILNAVGALTLVYAFRYGKAIIVAPLTGLAPLITIILSLLIYGVMPGPILIIGLILAMVAILILSI
ncbi:EamA family transporter [Christiangramia crocea]|uniref:DMT family transporter n=1 Tax=Christiangramia crocea TaxID=2904124 RepID=A0A9X2A4R0_9FLAO|nr:EamA family transporter [Gramella crocea]MCG9970620.1 DMT family transporter [Gramella crocea]